MVWRPGCSEQEEYRSGGQDEKQGQPVHPKQASPDYRKNRDLGGNLACIVVQMSAWRMGNDFLEGS